MDVASRAYRTGEEAVWTGRTGHIMLEGPSGLDEQSVSFGRGAQSVSCWRGRLDVASRAYRAGE